MGVLNDYLCEIIETSECSQEEWQEAIRTVFNLRPAGVCLGADAIRDAIEADAEFYQLGEQQASQILAMSDGDINTVIRDSLNNSFSEACDELRSAAITRLRDQLKEAA